MKILILSQHYRPENFRINEIVDSLKNYDHNISVLTGQPNYPEGKIYKGYKAYNYSKKNNLGIEIIRVPSFPRGKNSKIRIIINYLVFILSASIFGIWKIRKKKFDVVLCYATSPILQAIPGIIFSMLNKTRFVLYVQDLWPESLLATGNISNKYILALVGKLVSFIYKSSNLILISSRPFKKSINKYVKNKPIKYLPNSVNSSFYNFNQIKLDIDIYFDNYFSCVFAGNLGEAQALEIFVECSLKLITQKKIRIFIFGYGNKYEWLLEQKKKYKLTNLYIMGKYPVEQMSHIFLKASCLIVSLKDQDVFRKTVPNKLQAYMACGRPIIGSIGGEGAKIIKESQSGIVCEPERGSLLADSILQLKSLKKIQLDEMGLNAKKYFLKNFEHENLMKKLNEILKGIIK